MRKAMRTLFIQWLCKGMKKILLKTQNTTESSGRTHCCKSIQINVTRQDSRYCEGDIIIHCSELDRINIDSVM